MIGSIHIKATEEGLSVQTHLSHVSDFDKFMILNTVRRSLEMSEKDFAFINMLIQTGLDKMFLPEQNETEVSVPSEVLEMLNKIKGDNNNEG